MIEKPTRKRFTILALVFGSVVINYLDRSNISIAAPLMKTDLGLDSVRMGYVFSAFSITYALLQVPGGAIVDRVNPRKLYPFILFWWSLATMVQGFLQTFGGFLSTRAAVGVFEAPAYPMNNRIVTAWFPEHERASAIASYTSGQFIGLAFLSPLLVLIQDWVGWRGLFITSGLIGIVWSLVWYVFYRSPEQHTGLNQAERSLIAPDNPNTQNGGMVTKVALFQWSDLHYPFSYRKLWGLYIGQFCLNTLFAFFLTWFPTYLVEYRGLSFVKTGWLSSIPFLAAFFGVLLSGFLSDYLVRTGHSNAFARKTPILTGMLLSMSILFANYTNDTSLIIFFLSLAFFGNGLASITWVFISLMAPRQLIGLVGGVFNFIGGLAAVVTPIVIGYLVKAGDFQPVLIYIAVVTAVGFCSYLFLVGRVERIVIES
ncbi:MFS transporter [Spirosoma sp. KNUC1025]|uniref:MFS transporter n=1 Tax=Spirosoma sp. KNUC1025 TaxID=2894082 RepID=UPI00386EF1FA|nr:MFS transporter [Spirosoma sp. KNUC1025]